MRHLVSALLLLSVACSSSHRRDASIDSGGCVGFLSCLPTYGEHVCGDSTIPATCVGGAWSCPTGSELGPDCWCSAAVVRPAECTCTPSGWSCPDLDAGMPCPDPGVPCRPFACGPALSCDAATEYCSHSISDVGGIPDSYGCVAYPSAGCQSCECLPGNECEGDAFGGITVTYYGG